MSKRSKRRARRTLQAAAKPARAMVLHGQASIDIAAAEDGQPPKRPTFTIDAYRGGAMRVEGFYRPVVIDLTGLRAGQSTAILLDHHRWEIIGTGRAKISRDTIQVTGVVTGNIENERDPAHTVVSHARNGFQWSASVGVEIDKLESLGEGVTAKVNGQTITGPLHIVRRGRLGEVSFVAVGADENATAKVAATAANDREVTMNPFEQWLEANGFVADELSDEQKQVLRATFDAQQQEEDPPAGTATVTEDADTATEPDTDTEVPDVVARMRADVGVETERIAAIRKICASGQHAKIEAKAIKEGWTRDRTELEVLRASRPQAPAVHMVDHSVNGQILEAACLLTARAARAEEVHDAQTLEAADRRFRGGIGLQELLLEAAWANGYTGRSFRDSREVLRFAFGRNLQAGFSTVDIGGILSNVTNRFLLEGFFSVERTWRNICAVRNVSDFKTVTSYRLIGQDQYQEVQPGGELKHGTLGEEGYSNKADTYGLLLAIDRRDVINDDLGAITTVPRKLGRGSGLKINDVYWTKFLANSDFFKTANNNYLSGADTVLGIDGLTKAEVAFLEQVDGDGKPIGIMPAIVLVPTALSAMGTVLQKSLEIRDTTASTKYPVANPHAGKFRTEVSRYLANSHYTGHSAKAWYLLADPNDLPVIEVAFLNGQESPTIETAEADFNVLGIQMRGYHDFGVALQEHRGGVKSKGEA